MKKVLVFLCAILLVFGIIQQVHAAVIENFDDGDISDYTFLGSGDMPSVI